MGGRGLVEVSSTLWHRAVQFKLTKKAILATHMNDENARLIVEQHDDVLHLTISNPALRNALGPSIYETGIEIIHAAHHDAKVRVIILSGADG